MNKDFSKLRQFDPEAAKAGALVCWGGEPYGILQYVGEPVIGLTIGLTAPSFGLFKWVSGDIKDKIGVYCASDLRMAPLAWVRKSRSEDVLWPVYKGDRLYYSNYGATNIHIADSFEEKEFGPVIWQKRGDAEDKGYVEVKKLTFTWDSCLT